MPLSPELLKQLARLGASADESVTESPTHADVAPEIACILHGLTFTQARFNNDDWVDESDEYGQAFADLKMGLPGVLDELDLMTDPATVAAMRLAIIGHDSHGFLLVGMNDPQPADPEVYRIDHYDPGQLPKSLGKFSEFLSHLEVNS